MLIERFPRSSHVRLIGLGGASDSSIWQWAAQHDLVLVTQGVAFVDLSVARGIPPKVVCLAIGNASNAATASLLLLQAEAIERFCVDAEAGFLLLRASTSSG